MTTPPPKLYLQWHGDGEPDDPGEVAVKEVTHSFEPMYKHDVEYVRADIANELAYAVAAAAHDMPSGPMQDRCDRVLAKWEAAQ